MGVPFTGTPMAHGLMTLAGCGAIGPPMFGLRTRALARGRLVLALLALVLVVKAVVPGGYMLSFGGERFLTVTICADASGVPKQMQIAIPAKKNGESGHLESSAKAQHCAFASSGHAMLSGADPLLLIAALAFILLTGLAPLPALPVRDAPFLRPQLRGPPRPTV